jgi:hypothetical protein
LKTIEVSLSKAKVPKGQEEINRDLNQNFISFIVGELELRRKLINPGVFKVRKKEG